MWSIASSTRRVTWGVFLATLFTLVGCGGTSLRRPLVTDQTPLGTPREQVVAWHRANGWCPETSPHPRALAFRSCAASDRNVSVLLAFSSDDRLSAAVVTVEIPRPEAPVMLAPPRQSAFNGDVRHRNAAVDVVDALASELKARYGEPDIATWRERRWATRRELVQLRWIEPVDGMYLVLEEHSAIDARRLP